MTIAFWIICAYGITQIIVDTEIFSGIRNFFRTYKLTFWIYSLLSCIICTGTWVGFFMGYFFYSPIHEIYQLENIYLDTFMCGILASVTGWFLHLLEGKLTNG